MEWYMGKYIRPLSDAVFTIASDDLWIESLAIQQALLNKSNFC